MKKHWLHLAAFLAFAIGIATTQAGTVFYQAIPAVQSDPGSGISTDNGYTSAVDGGNTRGTDRVINGITLYALVIDGQTATADNCTLNALAGTLSNAGGSSASIQAAGIFREVLSDMTFNNGATDNSQQEIVLDPESLEAGVTYDLRVYVCNSSGQNRQVNLSFVGDGQAAVETGFFNEDDATTSAGGFKDPNQVYYINYRFTWDGDSTPGITIAQRSGSAPFLLYALTNEVVPAGGAEAAPSSAGAALQAGADEGLTTGMVENESDEVGVASDDFYGSESLNNNGRWISVEKWGKCWQPTNCSAGWTPYTNGTWSECDDCGWTFVSDEPWAWACYHYGRWLKVRTGCGWAWVPGKVWGASWVSWRQGRDNDCDCIGWAPLPPEAGCEVNVGVSTWVDEICDIGFESYTFIRIRDFGRESYWGCNCIFDRSRNVTIINQTINITNISYTSHVNIYCGGPDRDWCNTRIRQEGGREVGKVMIDRIEDMGGMGGKYQKHDGDHLALHSPKIKGDKHPKHDPKVAEHVGKDKIDKGWGKDKKAEREARNHIAQQNKGKNPKNTKGKLPSDVAQKIGKHGKQAGAGGGDGQHPGGKGKKGQGKGASSLAGEGQGAGGGFNQHPGGKGKNKGQGKGAATAGAAGASGGGFNQHPGKKGKNKARNAGQLANTLAGGGDQHPGKKKKGKGQSASSAAGGGGTGGFNQHPGKAKNHKRPVTATLNSGAVNQHPGKKEHKEKTNVEGVGQAGGGSGGGKHGKKVSRGAGQMTQGGAGQAGGGGGKHGKKVSRGAGQMTQGGAGQAGGGGGKHGKKGRRSTGQMTAPAGGGGGGQGGGGGGKKGKKGKATPPPF